WPSGPNPAGNEFHEITNTLLEKEATVAWRGSSDGNLYVKTIFVNTDGDVDSTTPKVLVHDRAGGSGGEAWNYDQPGSYRLAHDGVGGAILTWEQDRNIDTAADIYIQQIGNDGMLGANNFTLVPNLHGNFRFIWNSHGEMTHWDLNEGTPLGPNGEWPAESGAHYLSFGGLLVMGYDGEDLLLGGIGRDEESWIPNSWGISSHIEEGFEFVSRYMIDQTTGLRAKELIVTMDGEDMVLIGTSLSHDGPDPLTFVRAGYAFDWDVSYSGDGDLLYADDDLSGSLSFNLIDPIYASTIPVKVSYMYDADGSSPGYVGAATIFETETGAGMHLSFDMDEDLEDEEFVERLQSGTDSPDETDPADYAVIQMSGAVDLGPGDKMKFITVVMAADSPDGFQSMLQSALTYAVLADMGEFSAAVDEPVVLPEEYALHQNHPNPFNPVTTIRYDLPQAGDVKLTIYDMLGREMKVLVSQGMSPGSYTAVWDGTDRYGQPAAAGVYIYQLKAGDFSNTKKLVLLK
ncbi:MAG: T9SS type A sorting domain-containing protein, partial [Candidatus Marinimicrobia bacterium]|nr:T9SS type A sorting domain-containing protein [Candidatus Neomarinimicrobiota bacterium]